MRVCMSYLFSLLFVCFLGFFFLFFVFSFFNTNAYRLQRQKLPGDRDVDARHYQYKRLLPQAVAARECLVDQRC